MVDKMRKDIEEQEQISSVFETFDADGDGTIDKADLKRVLQRVDGATWTDSSLDQVLAAMDADKNGIVDLDEFLKWIYDDPDRDTFLKKITELDEPTTSIPLKEVYDGPRWMLHSSGSEEYPRTSLRIRPTEEKDYRKHSARKNEVVEVLGISGKWAKIRLMLSGCSGWVRRAYLHECPEGTAHDRKIYSPVCEEIKSWDGRLQEVRKCIRMKNITRDGRDVRAAEAWFLSGHYLGDVLNTAPKEVLFFGCKDSWAEAIAEGGFDAIWENINGELGKGAHFNTTSCGAFVRAESYMLICEVVLGPPEARQTHEIHHKNLTYQDVVVNNGKMSVQCEPGRVFEHPMRVVYNPMQCKPVYLIKLDGQGMYRFSGS